MTGCKDNNVPKDSHLTDYEKQVSGQDTLNVIHLVDVFFEHLEKGEVTDAIAMLHKTDPNDKYAEPQLLDNDQIARMSSIFKLFPIVAHRIDYIKFNQTYANEVKVSAIIAEATETEPEAATSYYFKVVDNLGTWMLCTMNTEDQDRRLISNEQADSLQEKFASYMKSKQNAAE